ncbi:DUF2789 family protein [Comamonas sp. NoAH]|uniref:DUF2789 family protein n=1 Tax=Comamonas halotolerans TaxID=3041496 RepID=UPI0024E10266|nr:DUF2789 family protein [Comamonas sp. NoAH]
MSMTPGDAQPSFTSLFEQLGLACDPDSIAQFIEKHRILHEALHIYEAPFWTSQQAAMLKEDLADDADWSIVIDQLNLALRERPYDLAMT